MTTTLLANLLFGLLLFGALAAMLNWLHRRNERMRRINGAITTAIRKGLQPVTTAE